MQQLNSALGRLLVLGALAVSLTASSVAQHYQETDLVSDTHPAQLPDSDLVNPWGLARSSTSPWWIGDNGSGLSTIYNVSGATPVKAGLIVTIPGPNGAAGTPTGTLFNGTQDFQIGSSGPARFLFVTEDGIIAAWNAAQGTMAAIMVNQSPGSVFKGATIGQVAGRNFLYVADFRQGRVEVFDGSFNPVNMNGVQPEDGLGPQAFRDAAVPGHYAPFNVQNIGGNIYVTFALQDSAKHDEVDGPGLGYVDVFSPGGRLLQRLQHGDWLNGPWGLTMTPSDFGVFSHNILVGQFGSGQIAAYNPVSGRFLGLMKDTSDNVLTIDGLWSLSFGGGAASGPLNTLFFTAGVDAEAHGLFGKLTPIPAELTQGNEQ